MLLKTIVNIGRLKGFFRAGINYSCYDDMIGIAKRKASGTLPKDILSRLISGSTDKKSAIQGTEQLFNEAVEVLGGINKLERQAIYRMPQTTDFMAKAEKIVGKDGMKGLFRLDSIYEEKELETIIKAEEKLLNGIKQYIPEAQNVIITPLGCGVFGNGYKLQVIGKDGQKVFGDKVLKVYREVNVLKSLGEKNKRFIDSLSDTELLEHYRAQREFYQKRGITIPDMTADQIRKQAEANLQMFAGMEADAKKFHGPMAEANVSEFMRYYSGHNVASKDGIAIPSFFGLDKTKFSLGEFIDKGTKAEREFDFARLSLQHQDFKMNPGNGINGICIDMGGIVPLMGTYSKEINSSKQNMRLVKSILSCPKAQRPAMLEQYKKSGTLSNEVLTQIARIVNAA